MTAVAQGRVIDLAMAALERGRLLLVAAWADESGEIDLGEAADAPREAARKVAQVALWAARRVDLFAPPTGPSKLGQLPGRGDTVQPTPVVAHKTTILYPSGSAEGPIVYVLPEIVGRLGPWEQLTYFALCNLYACGRAREDGVITTTAYELAQMVLGRDDGPTLRRIEQAVHHLVATVIYRQSEVMEVVEDKRGRKRLRRVPVAVSFGLLSEAATERPGRSRGRIAVRLPSVITTLIDQGAIVPLPLDALRRLGPRHEAALRVYAYALSQRRRGGKVEVSATVLRQLVRPQGDVAKWPSHFRREVERIAKEIEEAEDNKVRCAIDPAGERAGGWKLTIHFQSS